MEEDKAESITGQKRPQEEEEDESNETQTPSKKANVDKENGDEVDEILRVGVIKKIMSLDNEGAGLSASNEATFLVSKSVELFLKKFIQWVLINNSSIVKNEKKNIIKYVELVNTSRQHKELQFLYDLLPEI